MNVLTDPKQRKRVFLALAVVLVAAVLAWRGLRPEAVALVTPEIRDVVEVVVASGTIRAVRQSQVGAEAAGVVESLEVAEGDSVTAGQLLGRLRLGETGPRLAQAEAALRAALTTLEGEEGQLAAARRDLRRAEELAARQLIPAQDLDDARTAERFQQAKTDSARARVNEARAAVEQVRPEFGKREVRAPFAGVVIQRLVEPGTPVTASTGWFTVAEMSTTEIYVETDENNLGRLKVGQPAIAVAPAFADQPFPATLEQVGPNVDSERGVVGLRLTSDQVPDFILPNMTIDVNIEVKRTASATAVPISAVSFQGPPAVMVVGSDGRVERRPVTLVGRNPDWAALDGLAADTRLLRDARSAKAGDRVRPAPAAPDGPAAGSRPGGPPGRG